MSRFLTTKDKEAIDKMIEIGFSVASKSGDQWTFINRSELFDELDEALRARIAKTDQLFM